MEVYIVVFFIEMLLGLILLGRNPSKASKNKKILYLVLSTIILSILCGSRSVLVGYDTAGYEVYFERTSDTWDSILENEQHIETGYAVLCSITKLLGGDFQTLLFICSFFTMGCAHVFIYRHSLNVLLSVFILICFPFYYSSFDIIRHFLSIGFLLLGFKYIVERKPFKYALFILIGFLFHNTSLIYLLFYPLFQLKWNKRTFFLIGSSGLMLMVSAKVLANYVVAVTGKFGAIADEWVGGFSGGLITCLMYYMIFILSKMEFRYLSKRNIITDRYMIIIYTLFILSIVFLQARIATRYIMLFAGLLSIAIPGLFSNKKSLKSKGTSLRLVIFISIGLFYHMFMLQTNWQNVVPYIPFWLFDY